MFQNKKVRMIIIFLSIAAILCIAGLTLSYFSDDSSIHREGTTGTLSIQLNSMINLLDEDGFDILVPGDMRSCKFEIINQGNKNMDIKTTIALTMEDTSLAFSGDGETQSEFDLYLATDVELTEKGYAPKEGAKPLTVKEINGNMITYNVPDVAISGNKNAYAQAESINGVSHKHLYDYVLVFKNDSENIWQNDKIIIDVIVEGKQHNNTGSGWELIAHETVEQGSLKQDGVVEEDLITDSDGNLK